ncbi:c-type cytochrome [Pseudooceanicola spongiae]|uniref:C-type cytochrome n=1 Tax=Pseudooceanicola spongiae TaxID=2613965 RepID=A0A7L9WTM7_9RHOB|nr:cytochrome c [Pseudooceanicola spongiae]QOL82806.1 c-type cytochrome [Pseudooceanicola spongiae]
MNKIIPALVAAIAVMGGAYYVTKPSEQTVADSPVQGEPLVAITLPADLSPEAKMGQRAFDATCAECHGQNATGKMGFGPPLVHKIYEPNHHADIAFQMAVQNGVRAHHWQFGDMPAQSGLTRSDVGNIIAYVRQLQRVNGIN